MKRRFRHWTPQYARHRIGWYLYYRSNPDTPWLSAEANHALNTLLLPSDVGAEFGSGHSTCWLAQRMKHLTSVEHDARWHATVSEAIHQKNVRNIDYVFSPFRADDDPSTTEYVRNVDRFADGSLGFALVDGLARDCCALSLLPKVAPGGLLVVDDIHEYLDIQTTAPYSRQGRGPANERWAEFADAVGNWRFVHAAQGIKDTGIWIKPAD